MCLMESAMQSDETRVRQLKERDREKKKDECEESESGD